MIEHSVCICCKRRYSKEDLYIDNSKIGICRHCWNKIEKVPPMSAFAGTKHTKMLLAPFYYTGLMRKALLEYKFKSNWLSSEIFAKLLAAYVRDFRLAEQYDGIVSIPLSRKRFYKRGYNQAQKIAVNLGGILGIPVLDQSIFRKRDTKAQSSLHGAARFQNVQDAFLADSRKIAGKNIILLDDVFTYGATMDSCARELQEKGAGDILAMTVAVTRHV